MGGCDKNEFNRGWLGGVWSGFGWLRIGASGELLWMW
jgi:hypothetical protein